MNARFELTGPQMDILSYPTWAQDMVSSCADARQGIVEHSMWDAMRAAKLDAISTRNFMVGVWPVIERFPGYMSHSLLKTRYGRSQGDDMARRWLVRNIRVEQNHADYWLNWAEGAGVAREEVLTGRSPAGSQALAEWCEEVSARDSLAAGIAATNYAVEGATGDWSQLIWESKAYAESLPIIGRKASLRWLQLHAAYDDTHPWEALEIVCALLGSNPPVDEVEHIGECVRRSYVSMSITLDRCMDAASSFDKVNEAAA
ncbi:pyrroloquinoline quinone (PQQ) biosynthesis protein C [Luteibacter sp. Sphag1AF]|uniref:TenA family transcriptional regulator n=1 Tax=Luteibacter sp. Sphag1AF TaxID=2587031 RepID=UPI00161573B0|nr:iron-containing redox enzyme family protein [Luteibacter sp. Sphag1AF]MBB3227691.1 pyrroloquinoline quinone (PQQ) biosynthesis protein C [Luteibacter sp. Sphag1AF]